MTAYLEWKPTTLNGQPIAGASLTPNETQKLAELARNSHVLEIGSAYGHSAIIMAQAGAKHVLAVDPHTGDLDWVGADKDTLGGMRRNLQTHDVQDRVTIMLNASQVVMPVLYHIDACFELIFIDGDHTHDAVAHDLKWAVELAAPGTGIIAFHDYGEHYNPDVKTVLDAAYPDGPDQLVDTLWIRRP